MSRLPTAWKDVDARDKPGHDEVKYAGRQLAFRDRSMTDLSQLESEILNQIAAASDEAALEAVRVAALGKKGSISALLATLGKMSPEDRKSEGAKINLAKDNVTQALAALKVGKQYIGANA